MTKKELIELVQHNLAGGDAPDDVQGQYHPLAIAGYIELALEMIFVDQEGKYDAIRDWKLDIVTKSFCVDVACDEKLKLKYAILPAQTYSLRENAQIRQVGPTGNQSIVYNPRNANANWVYDTLRASELLNETAYWLEHDRIFFRNIPDEVEQVLMKLAIKFREFANSDEIKYPSSEALMLFQAVWDVIRRMGPEDVVNDSNPTRP